jgi:hypothetical protein
MGRGAAGDGLRAGGGRSVEVWLQRRVEAIVGGLLLSKFLMPMRKSWAGRRETMILFWCPAMIEPLDTATPARRQIIPFWGWERYDFMMLEPKRFAYGQGLKVLFPVPQIVPQIVPETSKNTHCA